MKEIRCFITNAGIATSSNQTQPPVFELSDIGATYSKRKQLKANLNGDGSVLTSFHATDDNILTSDESDLIIDVVERFISSIGYVAEENKTKIIGAFVRAYNTPNNDNPVVDFNYNALIFHNGRNYPDYLTFKVGDLDCSVWLADQTFKLFYPLYDIETVMPFDDFENIVRDSRKMMLALYEFDLNRFGERLDEQKGGFPSTFTRHENIRYRPSWTAELVPCWFGFNVYGAQGNFDYLLRDELYDYFKEIGLEDIFIEEHFPDLFKVNEFFIVPEWDNVAIPDKNEQGNINSQLSLSYSRKFDIMKYLGAYGTDKDEDAVNFVKANTYNVPFAYNNILLQLVNGKHSKDELRDFREIYPDFLGVASDSPDFRRMSEETKRFTIMLGYLMNLANSLSITEIQNKIISNTEYRFSIIRRSDTYYVTIVHGVHRFYCVPRFEHKRIREL